MKREEGRGGRQRRKTRRRFDLFDGRGTIKLTETSDLYSQMFPAALALAHGYSRPVYRNCCRDRLIISNRRFYFPLLFAPYLHLPARRRPRAWSRHLIFRIRVLSPHPFGLVSGPDGEVDAEWNACLTCMRHFIRSNRNFCTKTCFRWAGEEERMEKRGGRRGSLTSFTWKT